MAKKKVIADKPVYKNYIKGGMVKIDESEVSMDEVDAIAYIEKTFPETAKEFQKIQYEQWATF